MNHLKLENELISSVLELNGNQKSTVLAYIQKLDTSIHSKKRYRRRAMKQIREALKQC